MKYKSAIVQITTHTLIHYNDQQSIAIALRYTPRWLTTNRKPMMWKVFLYFDSRVKLIHRSILSYGF